jgi:hypothetical protein
MKIILFSILFNSVASIFFAETADSETVYVPLQSQNPFGHTRVCHQAAKTSLQTAYLSFDLSVRRTIHAGPANQGASRSEHRGRNEGNRHILGG